MCAAPCSSILEIDQKRNGVACSMVTASTLIQRHVCPQTGNDTHLPHEQARTASLCAISPYPNDAIPSQPTHRQLAPKRMPGNSQTRHFLPLIDLDTLADLLHRRRLLLLPVPKGRPVPLPFVLGKGKRSAVDPLQDGPGLEVVDNDVFRIGAGDDPCGVV